MVAPKANPLVALFSAGISFGVESGVVDQLQDFRVLEQRPDLERLAPLLEANARSKGVVACDRRILSPWGRRGDDAELGVKCNPDSSGAWRRVQSEHETLLALVAVP